MTDEGMGNVASSRSTRKTDDRPKVWTPPNKLETPTPPPGKHYRWVRFSATGEMDDSNVYERYRQGYRPVMRSELKNYIGDELREGRGDHAPEGTVRQGDLILMEVDEDIVKQRNAHYESASRRMQKAVDQEFDALGTKSMPTVRESESRVSIGQAQRRVDIDDD